MISRFKYLLILIFTFLNIILLIKLNYLGDYILGKQYLLDFQSYLKIIDGLLKGYNPYLIESAQTLGPPIVLLLYLPFKIIPLSISKSIFTLINLLSLYLTSFYLSKRLFKKNILIYGLILSLIFVSAFPSRYSIESGQPMHFLTLLLTLIFLEKSDKLKGFLISILTFAKTYFGILIIAFIKRKKVIHNSIIYSSIIFLISLVFIKIDWYIYYIRSIFPRLFSSSALVNGLDYYNQSFSVAIQRIGLGSIYVPLLVIFTAILLKYIIKYKNAELSVLFALIFSPISWQYYFVLMFPIILIFFTKIKKSNFNLTLISLALLLWWIEFPKLHLAEVNVLNGVIASHYLISAVILAYISIRELNLN